ncbi:hypothetical protein PM082_007432 [Marasmius tenuissimus]|nr:hypothetical protein PM082_007432 [Marasmius tenuissimus]
MKPVGVVFQTLRKSASRSTQSPLQTRGHVYLHLVITPNTPLASDDGSLAGDEFEEEDLTAGLVGGNWDGDAFEDYLSRVGVGAGMKNPMYALRDVGEASSTTSLLSMPSMALDVSPSSPVRFGVFHRHHRHYYLVSHPHRLCLHGLWEDPCRRIAFFMITTPPTRERKRALFTSSVLFDALPFDEDTCIIGCTEETE